MESGEVRIGAPAVLTPARGLGDRDVNGRGNPSLR